MMRPYFCRFITGVTALMLKNTARKSRSRWRSQISSVVSSMLAVLKIPALANRICTAPKACIVSATMRSVLRTSYRSACTAMALPPEPLMRAATSLAAAPLMSTMASFAPSAAKRTAAPSPMPCAPPVTIATLSFSLMLDLSQLGLPQPCYRRVRMRSSLPGGDDVLAVVLRPDVIVFGERVVISGAEWLDVILDQPLPGPDRVKSFAQLVGLRAAGLVERQRREVHGIVRIGGADRRNDIRRALDLGIFRHQRLHDALAGRRLLAEEAVGLQEHHVFSRAACQLVEAAAGDAPVRDHRHFPADALQRLHHLCARRRVGHQEYGVGAVGLEPGQLRRHVDIVVVELLDARVGDAGLGDVLGKPLLVRLAPGIVDQHGSRLLRPVSFH